MYLIWMTEISMQNCKCHASECESLFCFFMTMRKIAKQLVDEMCTIRDASRVFVMICFQGLYVLKNNSSRVLSFISTVIWCSVAQ